ncbi:MAG TPA: hypothetical protein VFI47_17610 [Acidimicrobiales bacterium]|nr:hypothetical protein [Acidimicrobiales bacterium]
MSRRAGAVAALVVAGLLRTSVGEAQETEPAPSATVSPQAVAIADVIEVIGVGWQPGSLVTAVLCGNGAARGSLDCVAAGRETGVDSEGAFHMSLTVTAPPSPCPCVVAVSAVPGPDHTLVPLEIEGAPTGPPDDQGAPAPRLVVDARLEGSGPWTAWFGASGERILVLTVRNTGTAPADMRLAVAVGRGDTADVAIGVDDPGQLEPGDSRTLRIPVRFEPLGFGRHIVAGEVAAPGAVAPFEVHTSIHPWGVFGAVLLGFGAVAAVGLSRIRRRVRRSRAGGGAVSPRGCPCSVELGWRPGDVVQAASFLSWQVGVTVLAM